VTAALEAALRAADTVVFDFDGVLADSEPLHMRSYRQLLAAVRSGRRWPAPVAMSIRWWRGAHS
jgi:beta-phosphoglucomutase-like phosphatase (HAD superfamily)